MDGSASTTDSDTDSDMEDDGTMQDAPPPAADQMDKMGVQEEYAQGSPYPPHGRTG